MKTLLTATLLAALAPILFACATTAVEVQSRIVTMDVIGMTCSSGCTPLVQAALAGVEGVEDVQVDYEHATVTVTCQPDCDVDALVAALEASGFGGVPR